MDCKALSLCTTHFTFLRSLLLIKNLLTWDIILTKVYAYYSPLLIFDCKIDRSSSTYSELSNLSLKNSPTWVSLTYISSLCIIIDPNALLIVIYFLSPSLDNFLMTFFKFAIINIKVCFSYKEVPSCWSRQRTMKKISSRFSKLSNFLINWLRMNSAFKFPLS
jgi:hypothetical protein